MEIVGTVRDILKTKSHVLWTTSPKDTVYDAVRIMGEQNIGALVVVENELVVGVISERDYSRKVALQGRTSRDTLVGDIVSKPVIVVECSDSVAHCMKTMMESRIRHLPVVHEGELIGLISMGDLVKWVMRTQEHTILQLQGYISGEYPG